MTITRTNGAQDNDFTKKIAESLNLDAIIAVEFVRNNFNPDDVFDESTLEAWAEANGYIKED